MKKKDGSVNESYDNDIDFPHVTLMQDAKTHNRLHYRFQMCHIKHPCNGTKINLF